MSCNGCRVLRKGCSDSCALRPCLQWIDAADAQGHATVFVAKFFGRAGLLSFISAVPEPQRPDLFRSLLYEAAGRTINPVHGAAGLMGAGAWHLCQEAVDTVLRGGAIAPMPDLRAAADLYGGRGSGKRAAAAGGCSTFSAAKRVRVRVRKQPAADDAEGEAPPCDLGLCLSSPGSSPPSAASSGSGSGRAPFLRRPGTPSVTSDDSVTTTTTTTTRTTTGGREPVLLNLFA